MTVSSKIYENLIFSYDLFRRLTKRGNTIKLANGYFWVSIESVTAYTVQLEKTHGLDFKTSKFPHHVVYSRYHLV